LTSGLASWFSNQYNAPAKADMKSIKIRKKSFDFCIENWFILKLK
jgi:hypothetical protein